jgi:hypothetical protein
LDDDEKAHDISPKTRRNFKTPSTRLWTGWTGTPEAEEDYDESSRRSEQIIAISAMYTLEVLAATLVA